VPKAIETSVKPSVLRWARETSGATVEEAARRLRVPASTFAKWERVESSLKLGQLRTLAAYFKRPLSALLLPEPPAEPPVLTDFRALRGRRKGPGAGKARVPAIVDSRGLKISGTKRMESTSKMTVPQREIANFCHRHRIRRLSLFGSVLREDFRPRSDVDVLVEFEPGQSVGLIRLAGMERELSQLLGRKVDLNTRGFLSPWFRDQVLREAEDQYVAP